jgi:hypothetical protein
MAKHYITCRIEGQLVAELVQGTRDVKVEGDMTLGQALQVLAAVATGKTDITGSIVKFRDLSDTKDRVTAEMSGNERIDIDFDLD